MTGQVLYANPVAQRLFPDLKERGLSQSSVVIGVRFANKIVREWPNTLLRSRCNGGRKVQGINESFEFKFIRKDVSLLWAISKAVPLWYRNGKFAGSLGMLTDITERKSAEEALRESEQRFRDAIDHFPNVLVIYDADRRFRYVNSKGLEILGLSEQEVIGRRDEQIFPPEMINSYLPALKRAVETKAPQRLERIRHASMGGQAIIVNLIPLLDEFGEIRQVLGIIFDIIERKRVEETLRETTDYLENLIKYANAPIIVWIQTSGLQDSTMPSKD